MLAEAEHEYRLDTKLPLNHPERKSFDDMFDWLKSEGAYFDKLKLRYYSEDYRGVHAAKAIKKDEIILFVPFK